MSVSGKYLTAKAEGTEILDNYEWSVEEGGDVLDRTVGTDNGKENEDMGVESTHATVKGYLDIVTGEVNRIRRGTVLTDVELYLNRDDATPVYTFDEALVVRFSLGGQVKGKFEYTAEIHAKGDVVTYGGG